MAALESQCMCMCMRIAVTVPEKKMMYAKLNYVFLDTPSPGLFLATVCLASSPVSAKGLWEFIYLFI